MKFRKKPVEVEARRLTIFNADEIKEWCGGKTWSKPPMRAVTGLSIKTPEGTMNARYGDWIIKGVAGEFYPCKDSVFQQAYEPIVEITSSDDAWVEYIELLRTLGASPDMIGCAQRAYKKAMDK